MRTGPFWIVFMFLLAMMYFQYLCEEDSRERNGKPPIFHKK